MKVQNRFYKRALTLTIPAFILGFTACNKDDDTSEPNNDNSSGDDKIEVPDNYDFSNLDYSGQTIRIELLDKLSQRISKGGDGMNVKETDLVDVFENNGVLPNTSKRLANKTFDQHRQRFYDWFKTIDSITSANGPENGGQIKNGRLFTADGVEPAQMVEKGLMGATFYYQATSVYLAGLPQDDNSNVTDGKGTEREHHFDEAFGYLGVPKDFDSNNADEKPGDYTGSAWFWGHYILSRSPDLDEDLRQKIFDAFLKGRTAISNGNSDERKKQVNKIYDLWEELVAANVVHYLNSTISDIQNNATGAKWHHWSEAKAFTQCLRYNPERAISDAELTDMHNFLKDTPKNVTEQDLKDAKVKMQDIYGFSNAEMTNL